MQPCGNLRPTSRCCALLSGAGLCSLSLLGNQLHSLPAVLGANTQLTFLDLAVNPLLKLLNADVEALARLPLLRRLNAPKVANADPAFRDGMAASLPACHLTFDSMVLASGV